MTNESIRESLSPLVPPDPSAWDLYIGVETESGELYYEELPVLDVSWESLGWNTTTVEYMGHASTIPLRRIFEGELTITLYENIFADSLYNILRAEWSQLFSPLDSSSDGSTYTNDSFLKDLKLYRKNRAGDISLVYTFSNCFLKSVSEVELDYTLNTGEDGLVFSVIFSYSDIKIEEWTET